MDIKSVKALKPGLGEITRDIKPNESKSGPQFDEMVFNSISKVNKELVKADKMAEEHLIEGKHDLHEVLIHLEKSDLSFRFMNQVRNKVLDAYNEVMRIQV